MKRLCSSALSFILAFASVAHSATVPECASGTPLSTAALTTLIGANIEVSGTDHGESWQEVHAGGASGAVFDCKLGRASQGYTGPDPKVQVANYSIANGTGKNPPGIITYVYINGGGTFGYKVVAVSGTTYAFCTVTGGVNLYVTVAASTCGSGSSTS